MGLKVQDIIQLWKFSLENSYYVYQGIYYLLQTYPWCDNGLPSCPIECDLYMEEIEQQVLATASNLPSLWYRYYVDDNKCKIKRMYVDEFTNRIIPYMTT